MLNVLVLIAVCDVRWMIQAFEQYFMSITLLLWERLPRCNSIYYAVLCWVIHIFHMFYVAGPGIGSGFENLLLT